jgi:L-lactate dehydrogenase (cytochrome)
MSTPINLHEVEAAARRRLPRMVYDFIAGGAEDERTVRANEEAFARVRLRPRSLVDVATRNLATTVLGDPVSLPVLLGPTGLVGLVHRGGELALSRAAGAAGTVYCASIAGSRSLEEVARVASGPLWFQMYLWRDRELVRSLTARAAAAGYRTLVLTLDVPVVGRRERDLRNGLTLPPRFSTRNLIDAGLHVRWLREYQAGGRLTYANLRGEAGIESESSNAFALSEYVNRHLANPGATWEWLSWLRELWPGRLAVKGVLTGADARLAVEHGADGVIVSNHGGRQLDGVSPTLDALPEIVAAVGDRAEVLIDGGVRRGTDVLKALALGARACLVARPYWYGLASGGEAGVRHVLELLRDELDRTLALTGVADVAELAGGDLQLVDEGVLRG